MLLKSINETSAKIKKLEYFYGYMHVFFIVFKGSQAENHWSNHLGHLLGRCLSWVYIKVSSHPLKTSAVNVIYMSVLLELF